MMFITKKSPSAPHVPPRDGRHAGVAAARLDGPGANGAGADRGSPPKPVLRHLRAARRHHGQVDSGTGGLGLRVPGNPEAARKAARPRLRGEQPGPSGRRRRRLGRRRGPRSFCRGVPERRAPRERLGACRHDAGPGAGRPHRSGHAAAVDRAGDRGSRLELRLRLRVRVLQHHLLAHAHAALADGEQPTGHLRAPVRRWHQRGAAPGAEAAGPQHSRFDHRQGRRGSAARSIRATAPASASISTTSGKSSAGSRRPRNSPPTS